jgi:hypothetical protein
MFQFTDAEIIFLKHYVQETQVIEEGPAVVWMRQHGLAMRDMIPLARAHNRVNPDYLEEVLGHNTRLPEFQVPWNSLAEFRERAKIAR